MSNSTPPKIDDFRLDGTGMVHVRIEPNPHDANNFTVVETKPLFSKVAPDYVLNKKTQFANNSSLSSAESNTFTGMTHVLVIDHGYGNFTVANTNPTPLFK